MGKADENEDEVMLEEDNDVEETIHGDDEEHDEDEELDEYEKDDFTVDDVDDEQEDPEEEEEEEDRVDSDEEERQKKKKRKKREEYVLDEDDYELLEDNNVFAPRRKGKFKRLKKAQRHTERDRGVSDEEEFDGNGKSGRSAEEKLKRSLFGLPLEDIAEEGEPAEEEDDREVDEEDEMADFIVDEEFDATGVPVRQKKLKRKKFREAPGVSSSSLHEAHEIFGDVDELLQLRKQGSDSNECRDRKLEDEFEPSVLSEKYMTEKDDQIRELDIPERIQEGLGSSISRGDINKFLELHHKYKLEIPCIAMYRKECLSFLKDENQDQNEKPPKIKWHKELWTIQDLDRKWLLLQKRKSALQSYYKRFKCTVNHQLLESVITSLEASKSEREVDDADAKFNLHFPLGEIDADEGQYKRPRRKSLYSICSKAGLWEVANKFGYSSEEFGMQLSLEKMRRDEGDELENPKETPEEMASNFTCAMFETPEAVLKGARHMAAVEISLFETTTWILLRKPLNRFEGAQWLLIQKAEEEKLIEVTLKLPEDRLNKLISDFNEYYLSDDVSKSAQVWNEQRKLILRDAIFNFLLPAIEKEARSLLTSRAKNWLRVEYGKVLWNKVSVGPYHRKENDSSSDGEAAPRVMACCWGPGKPATTFVMLDSSGEVVDVLYAGSLTLHSHDVNDQKLKKNDEERVLKFMIDRQPHVAILGCVNLSCTRLKEVIHEIYNKMIVENPRDVGYDMDDLSIVYGDESLARLYENSRLSSDQLHVQSGIVKRAVALGRYLQNPLAMVATLCGPGREILSWKLNAFEHFLTPDEKYAMVEQVMVDVTNQVGLDVNLAASHEWLFAPLQFISGLGPRKAASLQRSLVRSGAIFSRKDFLTEQGLGLKVFVNASGFLRVRRSGLAASSNQFIDLLDDTRIHPTESYSRAQELAKHVYDQEGGNDDDEDAMEMAIEHVRGHPKYLKGLDIQSYAKSKKHEDKENTLWDIKRELIHGFQDWRKKYEEPSQDEEFYMISGETEDTLSAGRIVQATVRRVQAEQAQLALESGLTGMLLKEDYYPGDWRDVSDLSDKLHVGDILTCKIKSVQKNWYRVLLVCSESEIRNDCSQNIQNLDTYYHKDWRSLQSEQEKSQKGKQLAKKKFKPRMIVHPRFQNIHADEAVELLSAKDAGESIFRPSSRGPSHLTLTLKVYDGVYTHKDIVEGGKKPKDVTSLLRIGKTLTIGEDTFEDLDEVMDRYVDLLVAHLKAMLNYRKFRRGTKAEVDELLWLEKLEYPMRIAYCFGISHEHPGTIILTYIRSANPHHDAILMTLGLSQDHPLDQLLLWCQCEAQQLGVLQVHLWAVVGMVQPMRVVGEASLETRIYYLHRVHEQAEMVAVEMDIQVAYLDHMVAFTVAMAEQVVMHMLLLLMITSG
ncbi:hypothetical protein L3X38_044818 [Prunus dulcis]|uniref:Transcription elongation factor spt6 n=1 Tax=Prunus dulcis TaxID=3755 RepID=A0AAD4V129_PRUDU|nr:hypothetical protein L3X38_044818 [Prunus dulcis]